MHIPDGFLDAKTAIATTALSAVGVSVALVHLRRTLPRSRVPLIGLAAAFIFAAQMLNFPVFGGTSGHLVGAVLAAVLLGPHAAVLIMSSVLLLQCLIFADGGVTALGANVFNMAVLAPGIGFAVYQLLRKIFGSSIRSRLFATAFAAWCSTVVAAIACAGELAMSGIVPWKIVIPAMTTIHMLIGAGEAMITTFIVFAVAKSRPEIFSEELQAGLQPRLREVLGYGLLIAIGLIIFVAPFASSWPDGLEMVAASLGFENHAASQALIPSPLFDYAIPGLDLPFLSTASAGLIGLLLAFGFAYLLARRLTPTETGN
jgi:cobalt/nickel transport system permease protein